MAAAQTLGPSSDTLPRAVFWTRVRRWLSPLHRHSSPTPRSSSRVHGSAGGRTRQKQSRPRTVYTAASALQKPTWPPRSASPGGVAGCGVCTARSRTPGTVLPHHPPLYGSLTILLSPRILQGRKVRHTGGTNCCRAGVKRSSHSRSLQRGRVRPRRAARAGQEGRDGAEGGPCQLPGLLSYNSGKQKHSGCRHWVQWLGQAWDATSLTGDPRFGTQLPRGAHPGGRLQHFSHYHPDGAPAAAQPGADTRVNTFVWGVN